MFVGSILRAQERAAQIKESVLCEGEWKKDGDFSSVSVPVCGYISCSRARKNGWLGERPR